MTVNRKHQYSINKSPGFSLKPWILLFSLSLMTSISSPAQSKLFASLQDSPSLDTELYFYASTLRMINIQRNPGFDEMVKDIRRMKFFKLRDYKINEIRELAGQFKEEGFEELMTMEGKDETFYILGRSDDEFISLVKAEGDMIAVSLEGKIGVHKIPELIESLNADNFLDVFEIGRDERKEHGRDNEEW